MLIMLACRGPLTHAPRTGASSATPFWVAQLNKREQDLPNQKTISGSKNTLAGWAGVRQRPEITVLRARAQKNLATCLIPV